MKIIPTILAIITLIGLLALVISFFIKKDKRRKKLVDSKVQLQIAVEIVLHSLLLPILLIIIFFVPPFVQILSNAPGNTTAEKIDFHQQVMRTLYDFNYTKWPLILLILIFIGMISILFSHHVVGPLHNLKRVLKKLREKDMSVRLFLRQGDLLTDIDKDFNGYLDDAAALLKRNKETFEGLAADPSVPETHKAEITSRLKELNEYTLKR